MKSSQPTTFYNATIMVRNKRQDRMIKSKKSSNEFKGLRIRVLPHPPEFMFRPWYALQVRIDDVAQLGDGTLTTTELSSRILTQLGIQTAGDVLFVRLQEVKAWGNLTGALAQVTMQVYDPIAATQTLPSGPASTVDRVLEVIREYPDAVNRASVGYRYSKVQQNVAISLNGTAASASNLIRFQGASLVYIYLLWRTGSTSL